jgi:hypothetical protein
MPPRGRPRKVKPEPTPTMETSLFSLTLEDASPVSSDAESGENDCVKCGEKVEKVKRMRDDIPPICKKCLPSDVGNGEGSTSEDEKEEEDEEEEEEEDEEEEEEEVVIETLGDHSGEMVAVPDPFTPVKGT